jgi:HEAT repeat protein
MAGVTRPGLLLLAVLLAGAAGCGPRAALDAPEPALRARAVLALGGGEADLPALLVAARDGSAVVRRAAAEAFAARGGPSAADALGNLLSDPDVAVVEVAARGLASMPDVPRARTDLLSAYANASPAGRGAIATALEAIGTSLREAVEVEARTLWERNLAALGGEGGAERGGAAEELGASGRAEAVTRLLPLVDPNRNPDRALAAAAARGLGEAGDWSARAHLEALLGEADAALAEAAAAALGRLGDPGAADALARAGGAATGRVAAAAVEALVVLPDVTEVGLALCEVAARTDDAAVAARAARHARGREAACPERPFLNRLGTAGAPAALSALGELGLAGPAAETAAQRLLPLVDPARGDPAARAAAARALGRLRVAATAGPVRDRAAALLARVRDARARWVPGALPAVAAAGFERGGEARLAAVIARRGAATKGAADGPEWIDAVAPATADELGALLAAAGALGAPGTEALLAPLATDPLPAIRAGAVEGLTALGGEAGLRAAAAALEDPDERVRGAAARALGRAGARGAPALARAARRVREGEAGWGVALARALGETGAAEAVPALAALLDGAPAPAAALALARIGAPAARDPLVAALEPPSAAGQAEAIEALAQLAARDAGPAIAAHLTSDRPEVRAAAARALGRIRYEPASERLEALRSDYAGRVRRAAIEALAKLPSGAPRLRR